MNGYGHHAKKGGLNLFLVFLANTGLIGQYGTYTDSPKYMLLIYYINFWNPHDRRGMGMLLYYSIYVRALLVQYILTYISSILRNEILEEEKIVLDL